MEGMPGATPRTSAPRSGPVGANDAEETAPRVAIVEEIPTTAAISEEERLALEAQFREEIERDHEQRMERLSRKQESARAHREERAARARQREAALIRDAVRMKFYQEKGYQRIEENGRERWIPAEEFAARQRAKARQNSRAVGARVHAKYKMVPLYLMLALIAMAIGAFLVR